MKAFYDFDPQMQIVLVVHPGFFDDWDIMQSELPESHRIPHEVCCGGVDRPHSVYNGLMMARDLIVEKYGAEAPADTVVAIHDGARPLLTPAMIERGFRCVAPGIGAIPAVPAVNSLRRLDSPKSGPGFEGCRSHAVDRSEYVEVQTPQIFYLPEIIRANTSNGDISHFTDDASLAEAAGMRIDLYEGEPTNMKITHPMDFAMARVILASRG